MKETSRRCCWRKMIGKRRIDKAVLDAEMKTTENGKQERDLGSFSL